MYGMNYAALSYSYKTILNMAGARDMVALRKHRTHFLLVRDFRTWLTRLRNLKGWWHPTQSEGW